MTNDGYNALHLAAMEGHMDVLRYLLEGNMEVKMLGVHQIVGTVNDQYGWL